MRPPVPYYGGKQSLAQRIVDLLPAHQHYVEPYGGSLAVLLQKPRSKMETVNDLDGALMAFWRVLRDQGDALAELCAMTPHSRAEYLACQASFTDPEVGDLERARRVWVTLTQGRASTLRPSGWRHFQAPAGSGISMPGYLQAYTQRIPAAAERLAGVSLEARPALELIEAYGRHDGVLLYVDPPYLGTTRSSRQYLHEMSSEPEHLELLQALRGCTAAVVLSGYHSPLYAQELKGWHEVSIATTTGNGDHTTKGGRDRVEVLWSNREIGQPSLWS